MKHFCRILATYFLVLALMPCADVHAVGSPDLVSSLTVTQQTFPDEEGCDFCSPLCNCNCCSQANFVLTHPVIQATKLNDVVDTATLPLESQPHWLSTLLDQFFHPPKV